MLKMFSRLLFVFSSVGVVVLIMFVFFWQSKKSRNQDKISTNTQKQTQRILGIHSNKFFEPDLFYRGAAVAETLSRENLQIIKGGVIPHHLLPGYILSDFFLRLQNKPPKTIILIGPNHYEVGNRPVLTSEYDWQTPFGTVKRDINIVDKLTLKQLATVNAEILENEHSIAGLMPYVVYYLPDVKVVPLAVSGKMTLAYIDSLVEELTDIINHADAIVVASIDFSHYLDGITAEKKDQETLTIINNRDYKSLLRLNNDHLDSPAAIAIMLKTMDKLGVKNMDIYHHTNSGELVGDITAETTSYFALGFY